MFWRRHPNQKKAWPNRPLFANHSSYHRRPQFEPLEDRRLLTVYTVNSLSDVVANDGVITFREAIEAANANTVVCDAPAGSSTETDRIQLPAGVIQLDHPNRPNGQLEILDNVIVEGSGTVIDAHASSQDQHRVFFVEGGVTASLSNLTITGGIAPQTTEWPIEYFGYPFEPDQPYCSYGGGIYSKGNLILNDVTVCGNVAESGMGIGGGIFLYGKSNGPFVRPQATLTDCTIDTNWADKGGGICVAGSGDMDFVDSLIQYNHAYPEGEGGGIYIAYGGAELTNSVIQHNDADNGGGFYFYCSKLSTLIYS